MKGIDSLGVRRHLNIRAKGSSRYKRLMYKRVVCIIWGEVTITRVGWDWYDTKPKLKVDDYKLFRVQQAYKLFFRK